MVPGLARSPAPFAHWPGTPSLGGRQVITLGFKESIGKRAKRHQSKLDPFLSMCQAVVGFMLKHDGHNFKAFFSHEGSGNVCLYLMTDAEAYDFELSEKLAEFAAPYIQRGLLDSVMLVPASSPEQLQAFFDPDSALRIGIGNA